MLKINWLQSSIVMIFVLTLAGCATGPAVPPPTQTATPAPSLAYTSTPTATLTATPVPTNTPAPTATTALPPTFTETLIPTPNSTHLPSAFDGERAYQDVITQVDFGPRLPGSEAHAKTVDWIKQELEASQWAVEIQETTYQGQPVRNIVARRGTEKSPWIILGAHYDSRFVADRDPDAARRADPVPGANDGASGVAVLLELARVLPQDLDKQVWLVFFDSEDQGQIEGWDWILGSRAFVETLTGMPDAVVIVDMIGDASLNIPQERNSDPQLIQEIWAVAAGRGHADVFLAQPGYSMLDDHTPFLQKGMHAIDIIDFDYAYWHTVQDTPDKVSASSLSAVGDTLLYWLAPEN